MFADSVASISSPWTVDSGASVHVCPKSYATHATLLALPAGGDWIFDQQVARCSKFGYARSGVRRDGSARRSVHSENPLCRL